MGLLKFIGYFFGVFKRWNDWEIGFIGSRDSDLTFRQLKVAEKLSSRWCVVYHYRQNVICFIFIFIFFWNRWETSNTPILLRKKKMTSRVVLRAPCVLCYKPCTWSFLLRDLWFFLKYFSYILIKFH